LFQAIADKVVETSPYVGTHVFHHLGIQTSLEAEDLFGISINHVRSIAAQIVEGMQKY
jgi:hypothetical protein